MMNRSPPVGRERFFSSLKSFFSLRSRLSRASASTPYEHIGLHERFRVFRRLLDRNNTALKIIADLEAKASGDFLFDTRYIQESTQRLENTLHEIVMDLVAIGGQRYLPLRDRLEHISGEIRRLTDGTPPVTPDQLVIPLSEIDAGRASSVGGKNASLGELKSRAGLPVPEGFAVSAWASRRFVEANEIGARIDHLLGELNVSSYSDLVRVSSRIQEIVLAGVLPHDLEESLERNTDALMQRSGCHNFAVRSSAIGEDSELSFAGQYRSYLGVPRNEIPQAYQRVLAGQFTPGAIYYLLSHALGEHDVPMGVGVLEMVDAAASGVVYTRQPVGGDKSSLLIVQSIWGLGPYLVDGVLTPDTFRVDRDDLRIVDRSITPKAVKLVLDPKGGVRKETVSEALRDRPSLSDDDVHRLAELALRAEQHAGGPRDVEWAIDHRGRIVLLQSRPLRIVQPGHTDHFAAGPGVDPLVTTGVTASPGAGAGPVCRITSSEQLDDVAEGSILVSRRPLPGFVTVMDHVEAIVTEVGGSASHMATIARERGIPALCGIQDSSMLRTGMAVTVDATRCRVYPGIHRELIQVRTPEPAPLHEEPIYVLLRQALSRIAPLNLVHASSTDFSIESCRTLHDITRFAHQRAVEAMFRRTRKDQVAARRAIRLKSSVPLPLTVVHLEENLSERAQRGGWITLENLSCPPIEAFWKGIEVEGWPRPPSVDVRGFMSVMATHMSGGGRGEFLEESFAILSHDYMMLSLRMGYHFVTIEALCTEDPSKNSIRLEYKDGGAAFDRRKRRVHLIDTLLQRIGFESSTHGDCLESTLVWESADAMLRTLHLLGRLNILTKQLDMALPNDQVMEWHIRDLARRLGLGTG